MRTLARPGPFTFEDFCALVAEDQKADLIDGTIYLAPPETPAENALFLLLLLIVADVAEARNAGEVYGGRVALRLDDRNGPEPDILFLSNDHLRRVGREWIDGPADLVVEMVSPESVERDYEKKRKQYER